MTQTPPISAMHELARRLRAEAVAISDTLSAPLLIEAAAVIEALSPNLTLEAENGRLRAALAGIDKLVADNIHDNGTDINRMKVGDEWHTGPVVDAAFRIIKGLGRIARAALVKP